MQGTFGLFNFFQQPNTGVFPNPTAAKTQPELSYILTGGGNAGNVADFNWYYPYAGTAVPFVIYQGERGALDLKLFSDSYRSEDNLGLRYAIVKTIISGTIQGNLDASFFDSEFSGVFYPEISDNSSYWSIFSGITQGSLFENCINYIILSGNIISQPPDVSITKNILSGQVLDAHADIPIFKSILSGNVTEISYELSYFQSILSGSFIPTNFDITNISYGISGFYSASGNIIIVNRTPTFTSGENVALTYGLNSFISLR